MDVTVADPKGLIRESFKIEGITIEECKTIFLDWAIQVPVGADVEDHIKFCLSFYATDRPDHPMTVVLNQALVPAAPAKRRGGRAGRMSL